MSLALEPCPTCQAPKSSADHRRVCARMAGAAPAPARPSAVESLAAEAFDGWEDELAADRARDEAEFLDRPPPTLTQDAPAAVRPTPGPSRPRKRPSGPRKRPTPWTPLPPPTPDTPWRVTRDVEVRTLSPNRIMGEHFRSRASRRNREHGAIGEAFQGVTMPDDGSGWIVTFVRVGPALVDSDRLAGSLYALRDAIADRITGGDDSPRAPVRVSADGERANRSIVNAKIGAS